MSKAEQFLTEFERELKTTRTFLERVPSDRLTWKPHEKSMTAGQLALHIASVPRGVLGMSLNDEASPPDQSRGHEQPTSVAQAIETLDQGAQFVRATLPTISDRRMEQTIKLVVGGHVVMEAPREVFLRSVLFNHGYHHRGQLGVYLRLTGATVPMSYGPSGDESPF